MKKIVLVIILVMLTAILGTGCGKGQSQTEVTKQDNNATSKAVEAKPEKIRFTYNGGAMGLSSCIFYVAVNKHILQDEFEKDGIKVEYVAFNGSGTIAANTIGAGKADFAQIGDQPVLVARANGVDIKAVGVYAEGILGGPDRYIALMARNDSNIKTIKDLKGKKVAVPVGTNQHVVLSRYLNYYGMTQNDIQLVNMDVADIRSALASKSLEAGMLSQPLITQVEAEGIAHMVDDQTGLTKNYNVIVVASDFAKKYPDIVRRVLKVHLKAKKWIDENPEEFLDMAAASLKLDKQVVKKAFQGLNYDLKITDDTIKSFEITQKFLIENKISKGQTNVNDAFDTSYLKDIGVLQ